MLMFRYIVKQNGINFFRVAFLLERMCPLEYGLGARFNETVSLYRPAIPTIQTLTVEFGNITELFHL